VRAVSRSKNSGPWTQWWDEMARKTVVRRLSKYLPLSAEDMRLLDDHDETEFDAMKEAAKSAEPQSIQHAALALSAPAEMVDVGDGEVADVETGEVIQGEVGNEIVDPGEQPQIPHVPIPEHEGNPHYRGWVDLAKSAIAGIDPADALIWLEAHADEMTALAKVYRKGADEVKAAAVQRAGEA
jgi:hypothetical protein